MPVVEGSLSECDGWSTIGDRSDRASLDDALAKAALVVAVGSCAAYGGLPRACPNPGEAVSIADRMQVCRTCLPALINVPGWPPPAQVISGAIVHYVTSGTPPEPDHLRRPVCCYGSAVHHRHPARPSPEPAFSPSACAHQGWCLLHLGCKDSVTDNACSTLGCNEGASSPMHSGHGCLGCSRPDFWDCCAPKGGICGFVDAAMAHRVRIRTTRRAALAMHCFAVPPNSLVATSLILGIASSQA